MNFAHNLALALDTDEYPNTQIIFTVESALSVLQLGSYGNSNKQLNQIFAFLNGENVSNSSKIHEEFGWLLEDVMLNSKNTKRSRSTTEWRSKPFKGFSLSSDASRSNLADHTIRVSNGLFVQKGFSLRPDYAYAVQSVYKIEVTTLDFRHEPGQSKDYINSWVKEKTLGKIPTLFDEGLSRETNMVLASTLYFQGFWETVFSDTDGKRKQPFYPDGPESLPLGITFMATGGTFPFYESVEYNCRIIGLPYNGNQTTMYVIQPHDSTRLNLQQLQRNLTGELINELISKMEYRSAIIGFSKFHVESKMHLKTPLNRMGIEDIFVNGRANLALIADAEQNTEEAITSSSSNSLLAATPVSVPQQKDIVLNTTESPTSFDTKKSPPSYSELFDRIGFHEEPTEAPKIYQRPEPIFETVYTKVGDLIIKTTRFVTKRPKNDNITKSDQSPEILTGFPNEGITKSNFEEKPSAPIRRRIRSRRETISADDSFKILQKLDQMRLTPGLKRPNLYVDEIIHKVDFNINEKGTEAAAATATTLKKTGPDIIMRCDKPFLILVRHDPTKLPLFYGIVNIPV